MHRPALLCALAVTVIFSTTCLAQSATDTSGYLPKPLTTKLLLWAKADGIAGVKDGERLDRWVDASGLKNDLVAKQEFRPLYRAKGINGLPCVEFQGDNRATPKVLHMFDIPLMGEWAGVTVFAVGKGLTGAGWLDTHPSNAGCLRAYGFLQLTGNKIGVEKPFAAAADDKLHIACIRSGVEASGAMVMTTYVDGKAQGTGRDEAPMFGTIFRNAKIGTNNHGETAFSGQLCEVLIYVGTLSDKELAATTAYLKAKYGLEKAADAPKEPALYEPQKKAAPPAAVQIKPVDKGLQLWAQADAMKDAPDGQLVAALAQVGSRGKDLTSEEGHRPVLEHDALAGRSAIRFDKPQDAKRSYQAFELPLAGEWKEITYMVAGTGLTGFGVLDTAPGIGGCLRAIGGVQLTDSPLGLADPFELLRNSEGPGIAVIVIRRDAGGVTLESYANGHRMRSHTAKDARAVLWRTPRIGTNNGGEANFVGLLGEVLIYDRALTAEELKHNTQYLAQRYGIALKTAQQVEAERKARSYWTTRLPILPHTFSYFGNSFSGKDAWVQSGIADICAMGQGVVGCISIWDEPHKEIGFYKDGKCVGPVTHGGGGSLVFDGTYLYAGISGMGKKQAGVRRLSVDMKKLLDPDPKVSNTAVAEAKWDDKGWPMWDTPEVWNEIAGMALVKDELFVTTNKLDLVRVLDTKSGKLLRTFEVKQPGRLAADKAGMLWVATADGVKEYSSDGKPTGRVIGIKKAGGLAVTPKGELAVADAGPDLQVVLFDVTKKELPETRRVGEIGGVFGMRGQLRPSVMPPLSALAIDPDGTMFVHGAGCLRAVDPRTTNATWQLEVTVFCQCGDFDPASDGRSIYNTHTKHDHLDNQPAGSDWRWHAITADTNRFGDIASPRGQLLLRRLEGRLYAFSVGGDNVLIHRQQENSMVWIPCGFVHMSTRALGLPKNAPQDGKPFVWSDANGDGKVQANECTAAPKDMPAPELAYSIYVDDAGGIWRPQDRKGIRHLPLAGFTKQGAPQYDYARLQDLAKPAEFITIDRVMYYPATDTMYLSGSTWLHPASGIEQWGSCGREAIRYDQWSKPQRKVRSRMPFPVGATSIKAMTVAAPSDRLFAGQMETSCIFVYDTTSGKLLGMVEPDQELVGGIGWIDIDSGIRAFTTRSGDIMLIVEDSWSQKEMVYRIRK